MINNFERLGLPGNELNKIIQKLRAISESEVGVIKLDSKFRYTKIKL